MSKDNDSLSDLNCNTDQIAIVGWKFLELLNQSGGIEYMTSVQRDNINSPSHQQMIFNTDTNCFQVYDSGSWLDNCFACKVPSKPSNMLGNSEVCANAVGEVFEIAPVSGATSYNWTVPIGSTITSGQGTTSITVDVGSSTGSICVTADVSCGSSETLCFDIAFPTGSESFSFGVGAQQFVVPQCVTSIHAELWR